MKKLFSFLILFIFIAGLFGTTSVLADSKITLKINGTVMNLPGEMTIRNGRVLVPYALLGNQLGATSEWNSTDKTVTLKKDAKTIQLTIGSSDATIDGNKVPMEQPATIENNRTMVPLRFVAESLLCSVDWNSKERVVLVNTQSEAKKNIAFEIINDISEYPFLDNAMKRTSDNPFIEVIHQQDGFSYVVLCYGKKNTGGYSVDVNNVYQNTDHTIFIESTLIAPDPKANVTQALTYPKVAIKFQNKEKMDIKANLPDAQGTFY